MEIRGHLEVKLWIWSGCFGHTSVFQLKNPAQVPPTLQLVDPNIWKLFVSKMIELDWFEIKQVAGAGFGGPLLNLKWLPCDQNKYL